jgi:multidrug efflux pump subunit AcrB
MINVSSWSIRNPIPAVMLFVLLTVAGFIAFGSMKVQNFPDLDVPTISVTASLPGVAPTQLETDVARKLENALAPLQGLKHITTKVQDGVVSITAEFRMEKPSQEAVDDVRSAIQGVRADLPSDLRDPVVKSSTWRARPCWPTPCARRAWTTKLCLGWSTKRSPASFCRCAAWGLLIALAA